MNLVHTGERSGLYHVVERTYKVVVRKDGLQYIGFVAGVSMSTPRSYVVYIGEERMEGAHRRDMGGWYVYANPHDDWHVVVNQCPMEVSRHGQV